MNGKAIAAFVGIILLSLGVLGFYGYKDLLLTMKQDRELYHDTAIELGVDWK